MGAIFPVMTTRETFKHKGDYIGGRFCAAAEPRAELENRSPADLSDLVGVHSVSEAQVDRAVAAARRALPSWRRLSFDERAAYLAKYKERLVVHRAAIAETIARDIGKAFWDANTEAGALASKVDLMLGEGTASTRTRAYPDIGGEVRYRPHGVMAVIGPFNFPAHLPNGQIIPSLLLGNTVVFKPSDKAPNAAIWMARCFEEAGFPPGVVNVVQGGVPESARLCGHDDIDGILFTGSASVGSIIVAQNAHRPGRLVALELGGKNPSIVLDDAHLDQTIRQLAYAAYATSGQRCTATSRVYVTPKIADALVSGLADAARSVKVGYPFDEGVFMGPVISGDSKRAIQEAQARARSGGFTAVAKGGDVEVKGREGHYLQPSVHLADRADVRVDGYSHDELFGPDVAVYVVDDLDHAIALANDTPYGLAGAVFTADRANFEKASDELRIGVLNWNRSSAGASGRLPFGGAKDSGNHRPAGITTALSCAWPQSILMLPQDAPLPSWPGLFDRDDND